MSEEALMEPGCSTKKAADSLHCCVFDEVWRVTGLAPPEVNSDLLVFFYVQGQVVGLAPVLQMFHLPLWAVSLSTWLRPTTVVTSANFTMWLVVDLAQYTACCAHLPVYNVSN